MHTGKKGAADRGKVRARGGDLESVVPELICSTTRKRPKGRFLIDLLG